VRVAHFRQRLLRGVELRAQVPQLERELVDRELLSRVRRAPVRDVEADEEIRVDREQPLAQRPSRLGRLRG